MLTENDLDAITKVVEKSIATALKENNKEMRQLLEEKITQSETFLVSEIDRMQRITNRKIDALQKDVDELKSFNRTVKLESGNMTLIMEMVSDLQKDVDELKDRIA